MKKVLYVTTISRTINAFLIPHIKMLIEDGYKVDCAASIDMELDMELSNKDVKIYNIPFHRNPFKFSNIVAFRNLLKIQKENNYDIVHVHTPIASIYGRLLKLRFKNIKTVYTAHGYHFFKGSSKLGWILYYPIEKIMARLTDVTININKEDYEITKDRLKPKKCYLVNGVGLDLSKYKCIADNERLKKRKQLGLSEDDFIIIMIAEFNKNKNQIQLIKALSILKDRYPSIKAILVGEGKKINYIKEEVYKRELENQVKFLGFREDINELINISDIGVLLSYREGLPRNIMELIANGKNIIATDIRGCRDIVANDDIGRLVKVCDFNQTAKYIEEYYLEKSTYREIAATSRNSKNNNNKEKIMLEAKKYNIDNINNKLKDIYNNLD